MIGGIMETLSYAWSVAGAVSLFAAVTVLAPLVSIFVTLFVVGLFRSRVARSMAAMAGATPVPEQLPPTTPPTVTNLTLEVTDASPALAAQSQAMGPIIKARRLLWTTMVILALAACWYPLVVTPTMTIAFGMITPEQAWFVSVFLGLIYFLINAAPAVLAPMLATGARLRNMLMACLSLVALLWLVDRIMGTVFVEIWLLTIAIPTTVFLLLSAIGHRVIGPIVTTAVTFVVFGFAVGGLLAFAHVFSMLGDVYFLKPPLENLSLDEGFARLREMPLEQYLPIVVDLINGVRADFDSYLHVEHKFGLFTRPGLEIAAIALGVTLAGGVLAWAFVRWLAASYREQRASDQILTVDVLMMVFAIFTSAVTADLLAWAPAAVLAAFFAYKLTSSAWFRWRHRTRQKDPPRTLLLLRVFGFDRRSQQLLNDIALRWRYLGPIRLIAGPDLATATIEPHEFFEFMNRRLSRAFVKNPADVEARLSASLPRPDPDGLYRIEDYFCHLDTWQATVSQLAGSTDAILMDLRGFSTDNQGCIFELRCLVTEVPLDRVVLLVDDATDVATLEAVLGETWHSLPPGSPNRDLTAPRIRVLRTSRHRRQTVTSLLGLLCAPFASAPEPTASSPSPIAGGGDATALA